MTKTKSVVLCLSLVAALGWAQRVEAQALNLPLSPTLTGALGFNGFALQATGGTAPYHYSITPGFTAPPGFRVQDGPPLPTNVTVSPSGTGAFLGVATTAGTFTTSIRVIDAASTVVDKPITFNVPPLQMSSLPPKGTVGVPYSFTMKGFGGGGTYTWSAVSLPPGLSIGSSSGTISGTPTVAGLGLGPTITMTDASLTPPLNTLTRGITLGVDPFAITTPGLLPAATSGVFYSQTLQAPGCGAPCTWSPASFGGLSLNSSGVLSGTPFNQTGTFTATVTGANGTVAKVFTMFISSPSTALSSGFGTFADQTFGNFITASVLPFGGAPPYTVSLVGGALPPGISLVPGAGLCTNCADGLYYLVGRAMAAGTYNFTLQFQDSAANTFTPAPYAWRISPLSNQYFTLPLTSPISVGVPYSQGLLVAGGSNSYTFTLVSPLPPGLSINGTGVISGTPTQGGGVTTQVLITDNADATVRFTAFINVNVSGPPTVVTLPATNVTNTGARLNGTYNPAGFSTNANFEWGPTIAYGNTAGSFSASGFNTSTVGFNISISCVAGSLYHYRLVASNSQGTTQGGDQTFTCAPQAFTNNADNIGAFTARLNGSANPNGLATTGQYQWGLTNAYGNVTPPQSLGSGTSFQFIDGGNLTGLNCSTTYHFRATATNANGTSFGADVLFSTASCAPSAHTGVATLVGITNATLFGAAIPNGTATTAHFEWGTTTGYGNSTPNQSMGSGLNILALTPAPISGLTCNTTYHFRVVATNSFGTSNGSDRAFVTAPCVTGTFRGIVYALNGYAFTNLIYGYGVTSSGALVQIPGFPVPTGGVGEDDSTFDEASEQLAYDGVTRRLYAINTTSNTLSAFSVNPSTGALTAMPFSPIALPAGVFATVRVHPSGSPVIVGDLFNGMVASYVVTPTTATAAAGSPYSMGGVGAFSAAFSRDGNYLYLGAGDGIGANPSTAGFSVAPSTGVLTPLAGSPFALGGMFPIGYATDGNGRLFAANNLGNELRAFTTSSGVPTAVAGNPFAAGGLGNIQAGVLHPSGFYMVANRGGGSGGKVGVFQIAGSGSATTLTNVAGLPFATGGFDAISLTLSKDGGFLFVAHQDTRNLAVFSVNGGTGGLTSLSVQPVDTLSNFGFVSGVAFASSGSSFGDFNADAKGDLLLRNGSTGQNIGWLMNGLTVSLSAFMPTIADTNWKIVGRGDFDGDGKADVILRNGSTGQDIGWLMNGLTVSNSAFMPTIADTNWEIKGVGDFDGDGKADVILRNKSTGQDIGWLMNGLTVSNSAFMPTIADTNWEIVGVGDFNGDGKADVLLRNKSTGQNIGWLMNGLTVSNSAFLPTIADTNWEIKGVGDMDGDGKADVILRNKSTGQDIGWLMNGLTVANSAFMPTIADTNWEIKGLGDFDGDGKADVILRNKSTGQNIGWLMNGLTVSTSAFMPTIADTNWEFVGQGQ